MILEKWRFRRSLEKRDFFRKVTFDDKEAKNAVTEWLLDLQNSSGVYFDSFMAIFDTNTPLIFPINITKMEIYEYTAFLLITDKFGIEYCLKIRKSPNKNIEFEITRKYEDESYKKKWVYRIVDSNNVELKYIEEADENRVTTFLTDFIEDTTTVSVRNKEHSRKISATFVRHSIKDEEKIFGLLYNLDFKYCTDIRKILREPEIEKVLGNYENITLEGFIRNNKCSEVVKKGGRIVKYSYIRLIEITNEYCMYTIFKNRKNE